MNMKENNKIMKLKNYLKKQKNTDKKTFYLLKITNQVNQLLIHKRFIHLDYLILLLRIFQNMITLTIIQ
ncbi:hypothetical protein C1645_790290 [Glomus cerebriforme]|uniref:Uncharacterized protein n=1 Tax=Glomus cerebriforme TaxID=658196 RepID=A0A397S523_9GLOM|nr:hypothetical protein C1645_790290 [Glomus cerebriforme]